MPLYKLNSGKTIQIKPGTFPLERHLQKIFEQNLEDLVGARFIASEVTTGDRQRPHRHVSALIKMVTQPSSNTRNPPKTMSSTRNFFTWIGLSIIKAISPFWRKKI